MYFDAQDGNVYFATGNGGFDADTGGLDFGDSVLKLRMPLNGQLPVFDYFTPHDLPQTWRITF